VGGASAHEWVWSLSCVFVSLFRLYLTSTCSSLASHNLKSKGSDHAFVNVFFYIAELKTLECFKTSQLLHHSLL
jgi:hypothetical protein